jgi:excisionase family DNA binding protein
MPPILLDGRELAHRLDVTYHAVMGWARRGQIPSIKTGRGVVFNLDQVVKAIRDRDAANAGREAARA